jgi:aminopeptidase N
MTSIEGPVGGMEYPMIVFVGGFPDPHSLYGTIDHEVAHQWFPMMVGNNETSFAWQDEGRATYTEELAAQDFFPGTNPFAVAMNQYLQIAGSDYERPMMREANLYPTYASFGIASYFKPAVLLRALGGIIGDDVLDDALREYTERWLLKHPYPQDFFHTVESVAGRNLDWFWTPWWYGTGVFDQGIAEVAVEPTSSGERVAVTVVDRGDQPLPTRIAITLADGEVRWAEIPIEEWLTGARTLIATLEVPGQVVRVELDPDRIFPDVDRQDNVWQRAVAPAGS